MARNISTSMNNADHKMVLFTRRARNKTTNVNVLVSHIYSMHFAPVNHGKRTPGRDTLLRVAFVVISPKCNTPDAHRGILISE